MSGMFFHFSGSPGPSGAGGGLGVVAARLMGGLLWVMLALLGLAFALGLLLWLAAMTAASLVASVFTGRPAAVTLLWRRYREMSRQHWPQRQPARATPRADAAGAVATPASAKVQDVAWREVPPQAAARGEPPSGAGDGAGCG
jgi:membrane protein implicated in regulation of membrane protease activity